MTMYPAHLRIDTTVPLSAGPSSGNLKQLSSASSAASLGVSQQVHLNRLRSVSNASSASSFSVVSPVASSTNTSTTSLLIPGPSSSRIPSPVSPDDVDDTVRTMPEYVLAMHDYEPQHNSSTCLSFRAGQVIHVLNHDPSGWWDGELEGKRGWFPSNYVNADVNPLVQEEEEDVTETNIARRRTHTYSKSTVSERCYPKTHSPHHARLPSAGSDLGSYVPPLVVPLLHGLSLLQGAARAGRISHFQPSTACIIACVRSVLNATNTLLREAPILQRYPALAHERRVILSTLASLVAQAKRASEDSLDGDNLDLEVEAMLRLAQQVFAVVRKFLTVAVQCGIELPERREILASIDGATFPSGQSTSWNNADVPNDKAIEIVPPSASATVGRTPTKSYVKGRPATPRTVTRARSMGDLRNRAISSNKDADDIPAVPPLFKGQSSKGQSREKALNHKPGATSVSSTTSSSSFSSLDSSAKPTPPPFPHGPCTVAQVMDALRSTHDHYVSAVAAFVGHAHSHSRASHPSSTGRMYDLVREIVEMSCKLLTIVEAVLQHPDIPNNKLEGLKIAKEGLYNVTSELAESVRLLTAPTPSVHSDEQEKQMLLRSATAALKAGSDLASSVKLCLTRSLGERPFIINLPHLGEPGSAEAFRAASYSSPSLTKSTSMSALDDTLLDDANDEDLTILAQSIAIVKLTTEHSSGSESGGSIAKSSSSRSGDTDVTLPDDVKVPTPLIISRTVVEPELSSPTSYARTDDGTTWEGSTRNYPATLEDKIINGDLPSLPPEPLAPIPETVGDPAGYMFSHDYPVEDIAYNSEGVLVGATLAVLVEKLTPHDSIVEPAFSAVFFMTFRLFCTPIEFVNTLIARYNLVPPPGLSTEDILLWQQRKGIAVRLRVSNVIKSWLDVYWRPNVDDGALPLLERFTRDGLATMFSTTSERIMDMIQSRKERKDMGLSPKGDRTRDPGMSLNPPSTMTLTSEIPRPIMKKTLLAALRSKNFESIAITDFDELELARQLTVMECTLYCAITPEEILESAQEGAKPPVNVKAVSSLSTVITGWVAESILNERDIKKRTDLVKFFIKVADRCVILHNYSTFRSVLAALDSSTISRLHQTWAALPQKSKVKLEALRRLADHGRNYREYRSKLRNTAPPAVPFLGLYLTDVTFCREGNPSHRASPLNADKKLLNFNKYHKLARIVQDMQRFQVPYNLKAIPEVQDYLSHVFQDSRKKGDLQDLYRRSLLVEPKQPADNPPGDIRPLFNWASRSQAQLVPPT